MKRLVILFSMLIAVVVFMDSCDSKKEKEEKTDSIENVKEQKVLREKPDSIALEDFLAKAVKKVKNHPVEIDVPALVKTSAKKVVVGPLKKEWTVEKIRPILLKFPLTVIQKYPDGSQNLVYIKELQFKEDHEIVTIIEPAPKYLAVVEGEVYLIKESGELWKEWK